MSDKEKIKQLFGGLQSKLLADLGLSSVHQDPNAKGDNSEVSWKKMLSEHLPNRYKVDAGIVIDHEGSQSDSIDIIIYDRFYSPFVFNDNTVLYIPAESVYAVIECKQNLDKEHIKYSAQKAASVRQLKRTSLPISQLNGELAVKKDVGIIAGVVTTRSSWTPPLGQPFEDALKETATISKLDFGCSLNDGSFKVTYTKDGTISVSKSEADNSLISFFIDLVTKLQQMGNVPAIDLKQYYN